MTRFVVVFHPGPSELAGRVHSGDPEKSSWDVFSEYGGVTADGLGLYVASGCTYVKRFLEANPNFRYIGSEDDVHLYPNYPPKETEP